MRWIVCLLQYPREGGAQWTKGCPDLASGIAECCCHGPGQAEAVKYVGTCSR